VWSFTVEEDIDITIPYFQDFETGDGDWVASGTINSWAFGTPCIHFISFHLHQTNSQIFHIIKIFGTN
jgi:hypothetical protein